MAKQRGIAFKFIVIVSVITVLLLGGLTAVIITSAGQSQARLAASFTKTLEHQRDLQAKVLEDEAMEKGRSLAGLLAQTGAGLIIGYDFDSLQQLADNAVGDEDIAHVLFTDQDNKPLTRVPPASSGTMKMVREEISFEGETVGYVEVHIILDEVLKKIEVVSARIAHEKEQTSATIADTSRSLALSTSSLSLVTVFILCGVVFLCMRRFVVRPVDLIAIGLNEAAASVDGASGELSGASQDLADGASEQAASLEETSASLEEISSMTQQNADNAGECDSLMKEVNEVVEKANDSIVRQTEAMAAISAASEETAKIVKTIDEIAFQTNLLALNAAVEAARAGEAGAGFAVVADEVRNLAMRSAEAAKNTSQLIDDTVSKVKEGSALAVRTNEDFSEVSDKASKAGVLVSEIATASIEQTQGISQVNLAINEIDQVTQRAAASSEETASASEELRGQSQIMSQHVKDLIVLLKGSKAASVDVLPEQVRRQPPAPSSAPVARLAETSAKPGPSEKRAKPLPPPEQEVSVETSPEDIIPMDDEQDFEDF